MFLLIWLKRSHIKPNFQAALPQHTREFFDLDSFAYDATTFTCVEWLVIACWTFAKSTLVICGPFSYSQIDQF